MNIQLFNQRFDPAVFHALSASLNAVDDRVDSLKIYCCEYAQVADGCASREIHMVAKLVDGAEIPLIERHSNPQKAMFNIVKRLHSHLSGTVQAEQASS